MSFRRKENITSFVKTCDRHKNTHIHNPSIELFDGDDIHFWDHFTIHSPVVFVRRSFYCNITDGFPITLRTVETKHVELGNGLGANVQTNLFLAKSHSALSLSPNHDLPLFPLCRVFYHSFSCKCMMASCACIGKMWTVWTIQIYSSDRAN